jgi:hypothetical protein
MVSGPGIPEMPGPGFSGLGPLLGLDFPPRARVVLKPDRARPEPGVKKCVVKKKRKIFQKKVFVTKIFNMLSIKVI